MDIRFLESLIAVVDKGSIAEASRFQALTPAALSQRIQSLERELGCQLLSRVAHRAKPSEACLNILPRARRLVADAQALVGDTDVSGMSGPLRIGVISTVLTGMIPKALREMGRCAPGVKLHITPGSSATLYRALQNEEVDAVIVVRPPFQLSKSFVQWRLRSEPLMLLSRQPPDSTIKETLCNNPYIRYDPQSWGGRLAERFLKDSLLSLESFCDLDGLEAISMLVAEDLGVSLVPAWSGLYTGQSAFTATEIGARQYNRELVLVSHYEPKRPRVLKKLVTILCEEQEKS